MNARSCRVAFVVGWLVILAVFPGRVPAQPVAALPEGVRVNWDVSAALVESTLTRERVCVNGLWRFQPAEPGDLASAQVPAANWGHFKVPGAWPGITDYMQKDSQTLYAHPAWNGRRPADFTAGWYQREITIPKNWAGRRIALSAAYVNSYAAVFVDAKPAGEIRFPHGEVDLSALCEPGKSYTLSMFVVAMPLKAVLLSYRDSAAATQVKGTVSRRGLCGDVWLTSSATGPRVEDVRVVTSFRRGRVEFSAALEGLAPEKSYQLRAVVTDAGVERAVQTSATSAAFRVGDLVDGRFTFSIGWKPEKLWDLHTPANQYRAGVVLIEVGRPGEERVVGDVYGVRFGFRELWIDGRDFYLNGSRIHLRAVPFDNAQIGAARATYDAARETFERLKTFGINFVYAHNYDCLPGSHLDFEPILRAADDAGVLFALTQPHFSHYEWNAADAEKSNGYAGHAAFYARVAGSHPSVVFYSTSHNATGYAEDMNPDWIGQEKAPRDNWSKNNVAKALRAEAIIRRLDPSRIVYHHAAGDMGAMHLMNFYLNFVPVQEMSDWFTAWSEKGIKPVFTCEYGVPFTWDWTMYRGWYNQKREFGSASVPWEFCAAEWNAQFLGDRAYAIGEAERANLRWEAKQLRAGKVWHRWDYPAQVSSSRFDDRYEVFGKYLGDNFRAFRTLGVSATSPWEYGHFWKEREGLARGRKELAVDWDRLQRPGISPDYIDQVMPRMDVAYERADWKATPAAEALIRNYRPLLGYIGGKSSAITGIPHHSTVGPCCGRSA